jgi:hypothetical protein
MDPDDVVALYPLDRRHFPLSPEIENKTDVRNHTGNQHGIAGYLDDRWSPAASTTRSSRPERTAR